MSQENVEFVRQGYEAWNAGGVDAILDLLDPQIEWLTSGVGPDPEDFNGHDGVRRWFAKMEDAFEAGCYVVQEIAAVDNRVFAAVRISARGRGSGTPVELEFFHVWTVEGGRAVRMEPFVDRATALEAAGLP